MSQFCDTVVGLLYADLELVVLGADTPLGLPLVQGLEKEGYIVIASISTAEAVSAIESAGNGYVRALVLDPQEVRVLNHIHVS